MRTHSGISPLFTMFNHDCNPAAKWGCVGELRGPMAVVAKRNINEGEEISVAYIDVNGRERERRDQLVGQIGRIYRYTMCVAERGAPATGGSADAHGFSNISQALEKVEKGLRLKKTK